MSKNKNKIDLDRRQQVMKIEKKRLSYKSLFYNLSLSLEIREKALDSFTKLSRNSSKTRVRNRCILTGRGRGVYKDFRLSRILFRQLAAYNLLQGVHKAV